MLSERDKAVLDFEASWWLYPEPKDLAVREHLGMSASRYYQVLRRLVDEGEALSYAPLAVRRLRKMQRDRIRQIADRLGEGDSTG